MNLAQSDESTGNIQPFPVSRYRYECFRYYYAYGNTPAEDFLSCIRNKQPSVLLLGCGDIRSCFYTIWKNFDPVSNLMKRFSGIDFVLNDYSTAVLARNIVFIYMCLQLPSSEGDRKKWLSAMWAIWYCHELYPQHKKILEDSLKFLLKYSKSLSAWACFDNPLHNIVCFTSPSVFADISQVWKSWLGRGGVSVNQMHSSRNMEFHRSGLLDRMSEYTSEPSVLLSSILSGETASIETYEIPEVIVYIKSGNCYAEYVFDITLLNSSVTTNQTLFERQDGEYSIEWCSLPYRSYHLTTKISPDNTKQVGLGRSVCDGIKSEHFQSYPLLATCVQQFCMWIQSSSAVLNQEDISLTFTFNNQHALTFCQDQQQSNGCNRNTCKSLFDAIFSSNLLDCLSPPNLVLSALPLLKPGGLMFTTTFHYDDFSYTADVYLSICFGFDCKLFPEILGIQWTDYDGVDCAAPVKTLIQLNRGHKLVIWNKLPASQTKPVSDLPSFEHGNITEGLLDAIAASIGAFFPLPDINGLNSERQIVVNNNCTETAMAVLQTFKSLANVNDDFKFWQPITTALCKQPSFKCILAGLQTQAILHNLHIHFGFPCVHIIDSIDGIVDGEMLKLKFFAPLLFVTLDMNITIARFLLRDEGESIVKVVLPATKIKTMQITFELYYFSCVPRVVYKCGSAGKDFTSTKPNETQSKKMKCSYCNSSGNLKICRQCKEARYCDRECQVKHWLNHKSDCQRSAKQAALSPLKGMHCACCDRSSINLKACTRCHKVKYCSKECQGKHWKVHKDICK
ncbi:hypothetical protein SPONN_222 [uncultured Candidatus Thioglobus sp.]|nr:hypothetical protein SPONN_222 [uncultured Candidatus Thioglobus sp.]